MTHYDPATIRYYSHYAAAFVAGTLDACVSEALNRFVALLPECGHVLDWGCGSGRDSRLLSEMGFEVTSVDASPEIADEAMVATGTRVRVERFGELREEGVYDGIWACASLLHVPPEGLSDVLACARAALRGGGVLYCSFKLGNGAEERGGRWFTDLDEDGVVKLLDGKFEPLELWVSEDVRAGRDDQLWVNCLAIKL